MSTLQCELNTQGVTNKMAILNTAFPYSLKKRSDFRTVEGLKKLPALVVQCKFILPRVMMCVQTHSTHIRGQNAQNKHTSKLQ